MICCEYCLICKHGFTWNFYYQFPKLVTISRLENWYNRESRWKDFSIELIIWHRLYYSKNALLKQSVRQVDFLLHFRLECPPLSTIILLVEVGKKKNLLKAQFYRLIRFPILSWLEAPSCASFQTTLRNPSSQENESKPETEAYLIGTRRTYAKFNYKRRKLILSKLCTVLTGRKQLVITTLVFLQFINGLYLPI